MVGAQYLQHGGAQQAGDVADPAQRQRQRRQYQGRPPPAPVTGSQPRVAENTTSSSSATTKDGTAINETLASASTRSAALSGWVAA